MSTLRSEACLGTSGRTLYLLLGAGLTAFALVEMVRFGGATWFALAFIVLPDVALIYGAEPNGRPGNCTLAPCASTTPCTASGSRSC